MGRKQIAPDRKKKTISIALTPAQIGKLQELVDSCEMTASTLIGSLIENKYDLDQYIIKTKQLEEAQEKSESIMELLRRSEEPIKYILAQIEELESQKENADHG